MHLHTQLMVESEKTPSTVSLGSHEGLIPGSPLESMIHAWMLKSLVENGTVHANYL